MTFSTRSNATGLSGRKLRTLLSVGLVALVSFAASLGVGAAPANAASSVIYCFKYGNGNAYENAPTLLQIWRGGAWQSIAPGATNIRGCGGFNLGPYTNYYAKVVALNEVKYSGVSVSGWLGETPLMAKPGTAWGVSLGTGVVRCVFGCTLWF